jgi:N-methylhydantoinase B
MTEATPAEFYELEIARGRLQAVVDEAAAVLVRTAYSNVVREAKDFACAILTPEGHTVVQSQESIPVFMGTMTHTWRGMAEHIDMNALAPGDVVATNDPWLGTGQLNDFTLIAPVFSGGRVVGFTGVVAHLSDIGGTGHLGHGSQMFEEGVRFPVFKLAEAGRLNSLALAMLEANVRVPEDVLGDLNAMLNSGTVMNTHLATLAGEFGTNRLIRVYRELESRTERFLRQAIRELPDGEYSASISSEGASTAPFTLALTVNVSGDELTLDYAGTTAQVNEGINSTMSYTIAYSLYACKCLLAPGLPLNEGMFRPIRFEAPPGSIINSTFPAPGSGRSTVGHFLPTLIFRAFHRMEPDKLIAECGAPRAGVTLRGSTPGTDAPYAARFSAIGGYGARVGKDGLSAVSFPTNVRPIPIEMLELDNPILFESADLVTDSGGPGRFRGGLGQRLSVRVLSDDTEAFIRAQWTEQAPGGISGGLPGGRAMVDVNGEPISRVEKPIALRSGDVVTVASAGSGGHGLPSQRDPARLQADIRNGYVSPQAAERAYGPAFRPGGS